MNIKYRCGSVSEAQPRPHFWSGKAGGRLFLCAFLAAAVVIPSVVPIALAAKGATPDSVLPAEDQVQLKKARSLLSSGKVDKASPIILFCLDSANDIPRCLALAQFTEPFAYPLMDVRRQCMQKALNLCSTRQDYIQIALKARQYEFYEITRQAIEALIKNANTVTDLYDLANKCQEVALNDVADLAMKKAYNGCRSVEDAVYFAKRAKDLGMEQLCRNALRDLINDEDNTHYLLALLRNIEPLEQADLNRYLLKKALDKGETVDDMMGITEAARRLRETDIQKVAEFRGKKLTLINRIIQDRAEYQRQLQAWKEGVQLDLQRQQAEAEKNLERQRAEASKAAAGSGSPPPPPPTSGF